MQAEMGGVEEAPVVGEGDTLSKIQNSQGERKHKLNRFLNNNVEGEYISMNGDK